MIEPDFRKQFNERVNALINTMLFDIEKQINIGEKIPWATVTKIEKLISMKYKDTESPIVTYE